jgi:hypothetical protein
VIFGEAGLSCDQVARLLRRRSAGPNRVLFVGESPAGMAGLNRIQAIDIHRLVSRVGRASYPENPENSRGDRYLADALMLGGSSGVTRVRRRGASDIRQASASARARQELGGCAQSLRLLIAALLAVRARIGPPRCDHARLGFVEEEAPKVGADGIRGGAS